MEYLKLHLSEAELSYSVADRDEDGKVTAYKVNIGNDYEMLNLGMLLSFEILYRVLLNIEKKRLKDKKIDENVILEKLCILIDIPYYTNTTTLLIDKHLRLNKSIDLDKFSLFNMKIFKEDILVNHLIVDSIFNTNLSSDINIGEFNFPTLDLDDSIEIKGSVFEVLEHFKESEKVSETRKINEIDIFIENGKFLIMEKNGGVLNSRNIMDTFEFSLELEGGQDLNDIQKCAMDLSLFIVFLDSKVFTFHNDVDMTIRAKIRKELISFGLSEGYNISLKTCTDCIECK